MPIEESIEVLLGIYGKTSSRVAFPNWYYDIQLPGIVQIDSEIVKLEEARIRLDKKLKLARERKRQIQDYYSLLCAKGKSLEKAVKKRD